MGRDKNNKMKMELKVETKIEPEIKVDKGVEINEDLYS